MTNSLKSWPEAAPRLVAVAAGREAADLVIRDVRLVNVHSREVLETVTKAFGDHVFSTVIHRTVRFPDAAVAGEPITSFASSSSGAEAYRRLAREVLAR